MRSASIIKSTEFVDLRSYNQTYRTIFDVEDKNDLLKMDCVEAWSPGATFIPTPTMQKFGYWQFYANTMHRGGGNGGGSIQRLVCFVVFTPSFHLKNYGDEDPIMAPEMLLLFSRDGSQQAANYLADWVEKSDLDLDMVLFNYKLEDKDGKTQLGPMGKDIRALARRAIRSRAGATRAGTRTQEPQQEQQQEHQGQHTTTRTRMVLRKRKR